MVEKGKPNKLWRPKRNQQRLLSRREYPLGVNFVAIIGNVMKLVFCIEELKKNRLNLCNVCFILKLFHTTTIYLFTMSQHFLHKLITVPLHCKRLNEI